MEGNRIGSTATRNANLWTTFSMKNGVTVGGGLFHDADGKVKLNQVTIWGNSAQAGGGIGIVEEQQRVLLEKGPGRVSATFLPNCLVDTATSYIATKLGVVGLNFAVVSACATGSHAIGEAAELIKQGKADVILAGGTEACITPLVLAGFCQMQALAPGNDDPPAASRPFDRARAGFVIAEGAAVVLLESEASARARGAKVYAEVAGYGASNDAYHVATPHPESRGVIHMFNDALR